MKFSQHVGIGIGVYFIALVPITVWILCRQGLPIAGLWQDWQEIFRRYWWEILICFFLCMLGAMMPDVDIKSRSQMVIYTMLVIVNLALILFRYYRESAILGFVAMLPMLTKHREQFHSYLAAVLIPVPLLFIPIILAGTLDYRYLGLSYYTAAVSGYMSHIIADRGKER